MLVLIHGVPAGRLQRTHGEAWSIRLFDSYRELSPRPVLGQIFEEDLSRIWRSRTRLPPFLSNLLPEGLLREMLASEVAVHPSREGALLLRVGGDLPGAISIELEENEELLGSASPGNERRASETNGEETPIKYSLAGVQLKLSALEVERGLTVPASGQGGNWIVKLPLPSYAELPKVEHSMLTWARRSGFDVPDHRLVRVEEIGHLPADWPVRNGEALAVRRFDRPDAERRIHQEDFAQILDVYPDYDGKYRRANHEVLGRILLALTGPAGLEEYVDRLVFMVLSGNGDAHVKNWSLVYPDGHTAKLSPLYDQVFTRAFLPEDQLALKLGGERSFYHITPETFRRFARKVGVAPRPLVRAVAEATDRIRAAWTDIQTDLPLPDKIREDLDRHIEEIEL